eukprot:scaffold19041_cov90-Isochrysis_galbana.AAC.4
MEVQYGSAGSRTILGPIMTRVVDTPSRARRPSACTSLRSSAHRGTPANSRGSSNSTAPCACGSKLSDRQSSAFGGTVMRYSRWSAGAAEPRAETRSYSDWSVSSPAALAVSGAQEMSWSGDSDSSSLSAVMVVAT